MEADAEKDKRTLKIIGNGTAKGLIRELKS